MALFPIRDVEQLIFNLVEVPDLLRLVDVSRHCRKYVGRMPLFRCYQQIQIKKCDSFIEVCRFPYVQLYDHFFNPGFILHAFIVACSHGHLHLADRLLQLPKVREHYRDYHSAIEEIYQKSQAIIPVDRSEEVLQWLCRYVLEEEYVAPLLASLNVV